MAVQFNPGVFGSNARVARARHRGEAALAQRQQKSLLRVGQALQRVSLYRLG